MEIRFDNKVALVTGAGKGIGRGIAKALVEVGATVYALSRTQQTLESLKQECPSIKIVCCDLSDWDVTRKCVEDIGPIDLLVNNAGINILQHFMDVTPVDFDKVMNVNVKAVLNVSQVAAKTMIDRGVGGAIVNISSIMSQRTTNCHASYCASKGALDQMTRIMALELGPHKIRVNAVCPTVVMTDLAKAAWSDPKDSRRILDRTPLGHFAEVEDVVNTVLFLLSDKSAMTHGAIIPIDGGYWAS